MENNTNKTNASQAAAAPKKGFLDVFVSGGKKGMNLWFNNMIPSIVVAGLMVTVLEQSGLMTLIGKVFGPVMAIFGLPGEAAALWISSFLSMPAGILGTVPLVEAGVLNGEHVAILLAMIMATTPPAKILRMSSAVDADSRLTNISILLIVICSILSGLAMRAVLLFL